VLFAAAHESAPGTSETSRRDEAKSAYEVKAVVRRTSSEAESTQQQHFLPR
jgi:hypothetical protein